MQLPWRKLGDHGHSPSSLSAESRPGRVAVLARGLPTACPPVSHHQGPNLSEVPASAQPTPCAVRQGLRFSHCCVLRVWEGPCHRAHTVTTCFSDLRGRGETATPHPEPDVAKVEPGCWGPQGACLHLAAGGAAPRKRLPLVTCLEASTGICELGGVGSWERGEPGQRRARAEVRKWNHDLCHPGGGGSDARGAGQITKSWCAQWQVRTFS